MWMNPGRNRRSDGEAEAFADRGIAGSVRGGGFLVDRGRNPSFAGKNVHLYD